MVGYQAPDHQTRERLRADLRSGSASAGEPFEAGRSGAAGRRPGDSGAGYESREDWRARLASVARRVAKGEEITYLPAVVMDLVGSQVGRFVRRVLREEGRPDLERDASEVTGLVLDVCTHLAERIDRWDPEGAPPWLWAERSLKRLIREQIGCPTTPDWADSDHAQRGTGGSRTYEHGASADLCEDLPSWAPVELHRACLRATEEQRRAIRLWIDVVTREATSERDAQVHVEYQTLLHDGHPAPSGAVAERYGMTANNVRQVDYRLRRRIREFAIEHPQVARLLGTLSFLDLEGVCTKTAAQSDLCSFTAA
ncbi:MAG: hypothetical protein KatS3mg008_2137 [Acidimicrobiales bacterium]|nr:MAG: hypothetical protein KatS3mg008_2137 [Acidimicrobiales bacterium]